jgi:hypothetical protein
VKASRRAFVIGIATLLPVVGGADEVFLKSGGRLSGRIVSRTSTTIEVDVGAGQISVPVASVVRIEEGQSPFQQYEDRAGRLAAGDVDGWLSLGQWASDHALGTQAREAYQRALRAAPNDPRANQAIGNVQIDGRWVSQDEAYKARGYVQFEGDWVTPAERDAILRERAADDQKEHALRQAQADARDAEIRAQEAEARARDAEAAQTDGGIPLGYGYGWGAGPAYWPTRPVVSHPIARPPRPAAPRAAPRGTP